MQFDGFLPRLTLRALLVVCSRSLSCMIPRQFKVILFVAIAPNKMFLFINLNVLVIFLPLTNCRLYTP